MSPGAWGGGVTGDISSREWLAVHAGRGGDKLDTSGAAPTVQFFTESARISSNEINWTPGARSKCPIFQYKERTL